MEQSRFVQTIVEKYHPGNKAFTRVASGELKAALDLQDPLPSNIWEFWAGIDQQMAEKNLIMFPPLPEAREGEDVRIYRKDAPLTRVLEAMLFPTAEGDLTLARTISALKLRPTQRDHKSQARPQDPRTRDHGSRNGHGAPQSPERPNRPRHEHRGGPRNGDRRRDQKRDLGTKGLNGHPKRNQDSQAGNGQAEERASAWQEQSRNFFRPLA